MKKKFIITENQANKILKLSEQVGTTGKFACMGGVAPGNYTCMGPSNFTVGQANVFQVYNTMQDCLSDPECPQGHGDPGEDPCKNPDTANPEECYICREPGAGCITVANAGMTIAMALANGLNIYSDVNQCNQDEDCAPIEPCPPPPGGCPAGTTWNQSTCHCDPIHVNDDPCNTFNQYNQINPAWGQSICNACDMGTPNQYQAQYCDCCPSDDTDHVCCCKVNKSNQCITNTEVSIMGNNCQAVMGPGYVQTNCKGKPTGTGTPPTNPTLSSKKARVNKKKTRLNEQDLCSTAWPNMLPNMQEYLCNMCTTGSEQQLGEMTAFCECCEGFTGFDPVPGCTTPGSVNYNANANTDDGSCVEFMPFAGCTPGNVGQNLQSWIEHYYGNPQANIGIVNSINAFSDKCEMSPDGGDLWAGQIEMNVPGAQAHYIAACECVQSIDGVGSGDFTGGGNPNASTYTQSQMGVSGKPDGGSKTPYKDNKSKKRKSKERKVRDKKLQEEINKIKKML